MRTHRMMRVWAGVACAALAVVAPTTLALHVQAVAAQATPGVLRIRVTLLDQAQRPVPVPRHALLVSDNPASTAPRKVVTAADGTATLRLPPGNYTVESDRALEFQGRGYQWIQTLDVPAGQEVTLELTAANAEAAELAPVAPGAARPPDPTDILLQWERSVVALWTPTTHASGVVLDAAGLIATSQQVVGRATAVEVQLSETLKVQGRVVVNDASSDVAVIWVDRSAVASATPVPLTCGTPPALKNDQEVLALGIPRGRNPRMTDGKVGRVASRTMIADLPVSFDSIGGPVFVAGGTFIGVTSFIGEKEGDRENDTRVVRADAVCDALTAARAVMAKTAAPNPDRLPMESVAAPARETLTAEAKRRAGSLSPYRTASTEFDVTLITPVQAFAGGVSMDFANWNDYVGEAPAVLLVRVTPKQVEKAWTKVLRGAAMTRGIMLPPIKSFKTGFGRMEALCGDAPVAPIHPFLLERRTSETDAVYEGLYVFAPDALHPECGTVTLKLYSEKAPDTASMATLDAKLLQQIRQDFAAIGVVR